MFLPPMLAVALYLGAWLVSDEVYAARKLEDSSNLANTVTKELEVAPWKQTVVLICPLH